MAGECNRWHCGPLLGQPSPSCMDTVDGSKSARAREAGGDARCPAGISLLDRNSCTLTICICTQAESGRPTRCLEVPSIELHHPSLLSHQTHFAVPCTLLAGHLRRHPLGTGQTCPRGPSRHESFAPCRIGGRQPNQIPSAGSSSIVERLSTPATASASGVVQAHGVCSCRTPMRLEQPDLAHSCPCRQSFTTTGPQQHAAAAAPAAAAGRSVGPAARRNRSPPAAAPWRCEPAAPASAASGSAAAAAAAAAPASPAGLPALRMLH